jgi:nucleotide-binding universal stress UspA family protein
MEGIVVGVERSAESERALRWALREAAVRQAPLQVVHAWSDAVGAAAGNARPYEAVRDLVRRIQAHEEPVDVYLDVVEGAAAEVLVDRSAGAQLLVVGSRGLDVLAGALLGSVSQRCVMQARCPVVVVRCDVTRDAAESVELLELLQGTDPRD